MIGGFTVTAEMGAQVERRTVAMGTELVGRVRAADGTRAVAALAEAFRAVARVEGVLSTWQPDASLARANEAPLGAPVALDSALVPWLQEAWTWGGRTEGAFDPAIGALVTVWDLRGQGREPTEAELARALRATGLHCLSFSAIAGTLVRHDSLAWLDAGAFGKGAGLRAARDALLAAGMTDAFLNLGGQVVAMGHEQAGREWRVTVAHPADRGRPVATLAITGRSVATTGQSERFVVVDGDTLGHVLDPRTGWPVPAWGSVTVVHPDPFVADVLSTALFVMGPERGLAWLHGRDDVAALFLIRGGERVDARWNAPLDSLLIARSW